jgi:hypothetical protein
MRSQHVVEAETRDLQEVDNTVLNNGLQDPAPIPQSPEIPVFATLVND